MQYARAVLQLEFIMSITQKFHIHNIDIEGQDFAILKTIDWSKFKPRVICIEDPSPFESLDTQKFLTSLDYNLLSCHTVSSVYCHSEYLNFVRS